ncbi:MAG: dihydropteroate synthase [Spirochaetales bacterium]|nr:dihydropteroate synthase [Spirochaetales bacterium]
MILIGERINAGFKDIKEAIMNKDGDTIKNWAKIQADAKATYIDVNMGTASKDPATLCWMIEQVQSVTDLPISIDNNKADILKEAIPVCNKPPIVNSTTAEAAKLDLLLPIVAEHGASIIGLSMDEEGSPPNAEKRVENAGKIFEKIMEYGIPPEHLFLDPIVMPLKFKQEQAAAIMEATAQFKFFSDPPCHIVCGLSNISIGAKHKKLINRIFCTMLIANGLDAVILDITDKELVDAILTAELFMNKQIYADSYIEAFGS